MGSRMIPGEAQTMVMARIARVAAAFAVAALEDYRRSALRREAKLVKEANYLIR